MKKTGKEGSFSRIFRLYMTVLAVLAFAACGRAPAEPTGTSPTVMTTGTAILETAGTLMTTVGTATSETAGTATTAEATTAVTESTPPAEATVITEKTVATAEESTPPPIHTTAEPPANTVATWSEVDFVLDRTEAFITEYTYDGTRYDDEDVILREGREGRIYLIYSVTYEGGREIGREYIGQTEESAVSRVVRRGTIPAYSETEYLEVCEPVAFAVKYQYDTDLPEGERRTLLTGAEGYTERLIHIGTYHGKEISRTVVRETVVPPRDELISVGAKKKGESFGMPYIDGAHGGTDYSVTQYFGGTNSHGGIDFGVYYGEKIVAVMSGTVIAAYDAGDLGKDDLRWTYGTYVVIEHDNGMRSLYAHLKDRTVSVGESVEKGDILGHSGNTGRVAPAPTPSAPLAGTHLHFELRILEDGIYRKTDPTWYLPRWDY